MKAKDDDELFIKQLFTMQEFPSKSWLDTLNHEQAKNYQTFLETERNSDRQKNGTVDFIAEFVVVKAWS